MKRSGSCYCAFCRSERRLQRKKHIDWTNVLLALLASIALSFIGWQSFDPKIIVFFMLGLIIAEVFVQVRWRISLVCPYCGFDPLLYTKSPEQAAAKVRSFYESRKDDPQMLLARNPFLDVQRRIATKASNTKSTLSSQTTIQKVPAAKPGQHLSKRL